MIFAKPSSLFFIALLVVLGLLQYKLWFSQDGIPQYQHLKNELTTLNAENTKLQTRNAYMVAEVTNLKQNKEAIEERARNDLGLVKPKETFYQIVQ